MSDTAITVDLAKELVDALATYAKARRRDIALRRLSPQDCYLIGENDRVLLPMPYTIKQLMARLRPAAEAAGASLVELTGHFDTEHPDTILQAQRAAKRLLARIAPIKRQTTGKHLKDKPLTSRQRAAAEMLVQCKGNKTEAAKRLGITRASLEDRLRGVKLRGPLAMQKSVQSRRRLPHDSRGQAQV